MPSQYLLILLSETWCILVCMGIAIYQHSLIERNKTYSHLLWVIYYFALCAPAGFLYPSLWMIAIAVLIREVVFSPFLNLIRGLSFWYVGSPTDPNGSELDKDEKGWQKPIYFFCLLGLIVLQVIIFK